MSQRLEERIRGAMAIRRMELVSMRHRPFTAVLLFRVEPAHYWTLDVEEPDRDRSDYDERFFARAVEKIRDWKQPILKPLASKSCRCGHGDAQHSHSVPGWSKSLSVPSGACFECNCRQYEGDASQPFVLVRVYSDGSRVRIGPVMPLDDAWGCACWWNYFEGGRYEAEAL